MRGGIVLFRGRGADARRYVEADRSRADDYYLGDVGAVAMRLVSTASGRVSDLLDADQYQRWVDWIDPVDGTVRGVPRLREKVDPITGDISTEASPMFAEIAINVPKSLSLAAAVNPEVSVALDAAQQHAVDVLHGYLAAHSVTRVGPRGNQRAVHAEQIETVSVSHKTSRAGDPHRHIHFQLSTRLFAEGGWRALDTATTFRQQEALRRLGEASINTHEGLQDALRAAGYHFDSATGQVLELEPFDRAMSKRAAQVEGNLDTAETMWREANPDREPSRGDWGRIRHMAWKLDRPDKRPDRAPTDDAWRAELHELGFREPPPAGSRAQATVPPERPSPQLLAALSTEVVQVLSARSSTWSLADIHGASAQLLVDGQFGTVVAGRDLVATVNELSALVEEECLTVVPDEWKSTGRAAAAKCFTSQYVLDVDIDLRTRIASAAAIPGQDADTRSVEEAGARTGLTLDGAQVRAAQAVAGTRQFVVVEGAAGAGKTALLKAVNEHLATDGRPLRIVTPTLKAADVASREVGTSASSIAKLVHAHGWRWDHHNVWTRLTTGQTDPDTGRVYDGPGEPFHLTRGETVVVDEAGMIDQDTARALLDVVEAAGARIVLVGDRAQLPAVGRGGVLDMAAAAVGEPIQMDQLHRFDDPDYAALTLRLRRREHAAADDLVRSGHATLHHSPDVMYEAIATAVARDLDDGIDSIAVVATNDEAAHLSGLIQQQLTNLGRISTGRTAPLMDGNAAGAGDVIQTRLNDRDEGVVNRQVLTIRRITKNGSAIATTSDGQRRRLTPAYLRRHSALAYAVTSHGAQGSTVMRAHVAASDHLDAAGLYVGATRGRGHNTVHIAAKNRAEAREQLHQVLARDNADRGIERAVTDLQRTIGDYRAGATPSSIATEWSASESTLRAELARVEKDLRDIDTMNARLHPRDSRAHMFAIRTTQLENRANTIREQLGIEPVPAVGTDRTGARTHRATALPTQDRPQTRLGPDF